MDKNVKLNKKYGLFYGGEWHDASDGKTFTATNPANRKALAEVAQATREDVDAAVKAAQEAFKSWRHTTPQERAALLNKIADIIDENKEHLAMVETLDNGKPIRETLNVDIPMSAAHFRYFASCIVADEGSASVLGEKFLSLILREPIGVVGQIIPWNFPFLMGAWKLAFTGSTEVGKSIALAAANRIIPATLEHGGKSANIFFDDCDFEQAIDGAQLGILFNQGQVCCAGSRIFVQDTFYDKFVPALIDAFNKVNVNLPWLDDTQMGAQISETQLKKILGYVELAKKEDATVACGGERFTDGELKNGCFMRPTLFTNVTNDMRIAQEEIFGPVACVIKFHDEDDVIKMANDSRYGLGGAVWTKDIARAVKVARSIETGRMWVNTYNQIPEGAPFGGYKESGIGRETHKVILEHYTQMKNIMVNLDYAPSGFYPQK